ncbi:Uncharacterized protein PBTT_04899 [Plasmodiophora brassicae]|uniref:Uncharacterized protein n=1 Tax=Plasmodiophora brassicae TaxID=37360 RepID=A0A3P3YDW3_PLABS|nr:unnamed protein product [Plasmodiophora brassicae]
MPVLALVIERNEGGRRRRELLVPSHDLAIAMCCGEGQTSLSVRRVDPERGALAGRIIGDVQCSELFIGSAAEFACAIDAVQTRPKTMKSHQRLVNAQRTLLKFRDMFFEAMQIDQQ